MVGNFRLGKFCGEGAPFVIASVAPYQMSLFPETCPFSGCRRPTEKARTLCEVPLILSAATTFQKQGWGVGVGVASHPGSLTSGKHLQNNQTSKRQLLGRALF